MHTHPAISLTYLLTGIALFITGLIIYRENPKHRLHRITGLMLFFAACGSLTAFLEVTLPFTDSPAWQQSILYRLLSVWELFFPFLLAFSLVFPTENPFLQRHPRMVLWAFVPHGFRFVLLLLFPTFASLTAYLPLEYAGGSLDTLLRPLFFFYASATGLLNVFYDVHQTLFAVINLSYVIAAIVLMSTSRRQITDEILRKQIGWVVSGIRLSVGLYALAFLLPELLPMHITTSAAYALTALAILLGTTAITWAIIKYQFLSVRLVLHKGVVFSFASTILVGSYVLLYGQTKRFAMIFYGIELPIIDVLFLLFAIFFFQPLTNLVDSLVEKALHPRRRDYHQTMQELSRDILSVTDFSSLQEKISQSLSEILDAAPVHLLLPDDQGFFIVRLNDAGTDDSIRFYAQGNFIKGVSKKSQPVRAEQIRVMLNDKQELAAVERLQAHLIAPLFIRGELRGLLSIGSKRGRRSFSTQDSVFLDIFCSQIALALENARLYQIARTQQMVEDELDVAREIQRMLLPRQNPVGKTFTLAALNIPSKDVGGDYHDFVRLTERHLGIAIGDIAGKGIPGCILMSNLQANFRAAALPEHEPAQVMTVVNQQLSRTTSPEKYATFLYAIYDEEKRSLRFCNAGHNYPIWKKKNSCSSPIKFSDTVIGIDESVTFADHELELSSGDVLVFYTDGITEALNAESVEYGEQRLLQVIDQCWHKGAEGLRDCIYEAIINFVGDASQYDDITLIVMSIL